MMAPREGGGRAALELSVAGGCGCRTLVFLAALAIATAGCEDGERHQRIIGPVSPGGVDLAWTMKFTLAECDGPEPVEQVVHTDCSNGEIISAETFRVEVEGASASLLDLEVEGCELGLCYVSALVRGEAAGTARFNVTINDVGPVSHELEVLLVRASRVYPVEVGLGIPEHVTEGVAPVFVRSELLVEQTHLSAEEGPFPPFDSVLQGSAPWILEGPELATLEDLEEGDPIALLHVRETLGEVALATEQGGRLTFDVVDRSSISSMRFIGQAATPIEGSLSLEQGERRPFYVAPFGANDQVIFGAGELPTFTVEGSAVSIERLYGLTYIAAAQEPGAATVEFQFDDVSAVLPISVE